MMGLSRPSSWTKKVTYFLLSFKISMLYNGLMSASFLVLPLTNPRFSTTTTLVDSHSSIRTISNLDNHRIPWSLSNVYDFKLSSSSRPDDNDYYDDEQGVGLYIHIPYCRRRCRYCNFAIVPIGLVNTTSSPSMPMLMKQEEGFLKIDQTYKDAILLELELIRMSLHRNRHPSPSSHSSSKRIQLRSIYFGGGTPSLAPISTIQSILHAIYMNETHSPFYIAHKSKIELSIEMDPGTFTIDYIQALKDLGFNRISLGVQSFHDNTLQLLGRTHRYIDILTSIQYISQVGIENYSIDLITGLPTMDIPLWIETLNIATTQLHPPPTHLSIYDLQVEKGTTFGQWYPYRQQGQEQDEDEEEKENYKNRTSLRIHVDKPTLPSLEDCAFMYRYTSGYLRSKGYDHYEISSYARSSPSSKEYQTRKNSTCTSSSSSSNSTWRSQHNQMYWETGAEWYALGLGATSFINGLRYTRPLPMKDYIDWVHKQFNAAAVQQTDEWIPPWMGKHEKEEVSSLEDSLLLDVILTRLRTKEGLDLHWVSQLRNGSQKVSAILRGAALGLDLGLITKRNNCIRLVDPNGFLFSNELISSIFYEVETILERE